MKNRLQIALLCFFCVLSGCKDMSTRNVRSDKDLAYGVPLSEQFVIGAFHGPPMEQVTIERYREVLDAGIDVLIPFNAWTLEEHIRMLETSDRVGLRLIMAPPSAFVSVDNWQKPLAPNLVESVVRDYAPYDLMVAYCLKDEPHAKHFPRLAELSEALRRLDPKRPPYINLFPNYASSEQLGTPTYREHVQRFVTQVRPEILCYDHYPLRTDRSAETGWYENLAIIREEAGKAGIPFWIFIQSEGIKDALRIPNREEVFWQANCAMAYGARGLLWFTYWTPPPPPADLPDDAPAVAREYHVGGMIERDGHKTPVYGYVRQANQWAHRVGPALLDWESRHIARYADGRLIEGSSPLITPQGQDFHLLIGTFARPNSHRVLVVNDSYENSTSFQLATCTKQRIPQVLASHGTNVPDSENELHTHTWKMEPGGAVLLEVDNHGN